MPDTTTAVRTDITPVETLVAIALAASWKPLMKSKISAATMTKMRDSSMFHSDGGERVRDLFAAIHGFLKIV